MWLKRKLREPLAAYMLALLFFVMQIFVMVQFYKEGDSLINYRTDANYVVFMFKQNAAAFSEPLMAQSRGDSVAQKRQEWAENARDVWLFARDIFSERYYAATEASQDYPANDDMLLLLNLSLFDGFDYVTYEMPRPETLIGEEKWNLLRDYYRDLGMPEAMLDRLFHPYDLYLGDNAAEAPVLLREEPAGGYLFHLQQIVHYANTVLSDYPSVIYHAAMLPSLLTQILGNRMILLLFFIVCLALTSTLLAEDRTLGTIRPLTARPHGRSRYFAACYKGGLLLAGGAFLLSLLPGVAVSLLRFGVKGMTYPHMTLNYTYRHLEPVTLDRGAITYHTEGLWTRGREKTFLPDFDTLRIGIPVWKILLLAFVFLFLFMSLALLIGFLLSTVSKNKNVTAALTILPIALIGLSLYNPAFATASFPYNPFAALDIMAVVQGIQDFTALAALLALIGWNLVAVLLSLWVIRRKNLG